MCTICLHVYTCTHGTTVTRTAPLIHNTLQCAVSDHNTFQRTKETACSNVCVLHYTSVQHTLPHVQHRHRAIIKRPCSVTPSLHQPSEKNWQMRSLREKLESNMKGTLVLGEKSHLNNALSSVFSSVEGFPCIQLHLSTTVEPRLTDTPEMRTSTIIRTFRSVPNVSP